MKYIKFRWVGAVLSLNANWKMCELEDAYIKSARCKLITAFMNAEFEINQNPK
jgi:hypothetical protein